MGKYQDFGIALDRVFRNLLNFFKDDVDARIDEQKTRVDSLIVGTPQPSEVVDARGTFPVLRDRLDDVSSQMAQNVKKTPWISVEEYNADKTGVTDSSVSFNNTINALPVNGGGLVIPDGTYKLDSDVSFGSKIINVIMGANVKFTGIGKMPVSIINIMHQIRGQYYITKPSGSSKDQGHSTFTAEVEPTADFQGNAVAGYFGAKGLADTGVSTSGIWALNPIVNVQSGYKGAVRGIEVDIDNYSTVANGVYGLTFWGGGDASPTSAILISRTNTVSNWGTGIDIRRAGIGMIFKEISNYGIIFDQLTGNAIKFRPASDNANSQMYGTNAADSAVLWRVRNDGTAHFQGIQLGTTADATIKKHHSMLLTITPSVIVANSQAEYSLVIPSTFVQGDTISVTPVGVPESGIMWDAYYTATAGTAKLRLANFTTGAITPTVTSWRVDLWKH